jgi:hypothetical protein
MKTQAYLELQRVRKLSAFDIIGATSARKLNQYAKRYTFADGSSLTFHKGAFAISRNASGLGDCVSQVNVNTF